MTTKGQRPAPKSAKMVETEDPKQLEEALDSLKKVQEKLTQIDDQFSKDFLALEAKANLKRKPLYDERRKFLHKIPFFWANCLCNTPIVSQFLSESDVDVLRELKDLNVEVAPDVKSGFKLIFTFNKNSFFEPETITKQFAFTEGNEDPQITTTKINWKNDPRKKAAKPTNPAGGSKSSKKRTHEETESVSFFDFLESDDPEFIDMADSIKEVFSDPLSLYLQNGEDDDDEEGEDEEEEEDGSEDESHTKKLLESFGDEDDDDDADFAVAGEEHSDDDDDEGVAEE